MKKNDSNDKKYNYKEKRKAKNKKNVNGMEEGKKDYMWKVKTEENV
jgi:hypothetical protein